MHLQSSERWKPSLANRGFTIVELLVVMTIMAVLVSMLIPAIQAARELARRTHCQNNLKQVGLALLAYHDSHASFPHGGWGQEWVGVPERGVGRRQPGGWIYCSLPFLEENELHNLGLHVTGHTATELYSRRLQTPLGLFTCPSRRSCNAWPVSDRYPHVSNPKPFGEVSVVARADYAINAGSSHIFGAGGPADFAEGDDENYWRRGPSIRTFSGISHLRTAAAMRSIIDGASKTYLVGEKHLRPADYLTGESLGDNESQYAGYCTDLHRFAGVVERIALSLLPYAEPVHDHIVVSDGISGAARFGSAHSSGFNMAHCDGAIHFVSFDIDAEVHFRSGHRRDCGDPLATLLRPN
jgi:prepilin-type N-terminal cleavage/methylation domain-containing protein